MSLTKLSLGGNNLYMTSLFRPRKSLVSDISAGDGNIEKLFLRCNFNRLLNEGGEHYRIVHGKPTLDIRFGNYKEMQPNCL
jgi:hypothetical protein